VTDPTTADAEEMALVLFACNSTIEWRLGSMYCSADESLSESKISASSFRVKFLVRQSHVTHEILAANA
jgi:hypothetical protein